jgi:hypothetical protein
MKMKKMRPAEIILRREGRGIKEIGEKGEFH